MIVTLCNFPACGRYSIWARSRSVLKRSGTKDFSALALEKSRQLVDFSARRFATTLHWSIFHMPEIHRVSQSSKINSTLSTYNNTTAAFDYQLPLRIKYWCFLAVGIVFVSQYGPCAFRQIHIYTLCIIVVCDKQAGPF